MEKITLCPGPGAKIKEWYSSQKEFFGRGDREYLKIKSNVEKWLNKVSGQDLTISIAGAATTAAYIAFKNFLDKKILIIDTGYYSKRWIKLISQIYNPKDITIVNYENIKNIKKKYNWIIFVYVETASCKKLDIKKVFNLKKKN